MSQVTAPFANLGTAWTAINGSAGGLQNVCVFQWTE